MAIPKFLEDLAIISKLGNYPGSDNNLSTSQLKAKFDEGVLKLQAYINDILIPKLDQIVDVDALLQSVIDKTLTRADMSAEAKATGNALNKKLDKAGGTMSGDLNMGNKRISNTAVPTEDADAANKGYVDSRHLLFEVVLLASGWPDSAPFTQTVELADVLAADYPHWGLVMSEDTETAVAEQDAFSVVDDLDTADGSITFTCLQEKPEVDLTIQLEVNR